jgi:hypothetical protein
MQWMQAGQFNLGKCVLRSKGRTSLTDSFETPVFENSPPARFPFRKCRAIREVPLSGALFLLDLTLRNTQQC